MIRSALLNEARRIQAASGTYGPSVRSLATAAPAAAAKIRKPGGKDIVFIEGVRTPFMHALTDFKCFWPHQLSQFTLEGLKERVKYDSLNIDHIVIGSNIMELKTSNIAREAALCAGYSCKVPSHTVTLGCTSGNCATSVACSFLASNDSHHACIAGGVEMLSDIPIRHSRKMRALFFRNMKSKSTMDTIKLFSEVKMDYLTPEVPPIAEFSTGEIMGHYADRVGAAFGLTRKDLDEFSLRSNVLALKAQQAGLLKDVLPVKVPGKSEPVTKDNAIKATSMEILGKLKPMFVRPHGTITAASSSHLADGASACLVATEERAKELGWKPKAYVRDFYYVGQDPIDQLLLGPVYVIPKLLARNGLTIQDIGVWEFHEAFSSQVLACLKAINSDYFCKTFLKLPGKYGEIPLDKLNTWGGSVAIGHPFGGTGVRLITHAANRMIHENQQFAVIASCASGGQGAGMLLERHPNGVF